VNRGGVGVDRKLRESGRKIYLCQVTNLNFDSRSYGLVGLEERYQVWRIFGENNRLDPQKVSDEQRNRDAQWSFIRWFVEEDYFFHFFIFLNQLSGMEESGLQITSLP